MYNDQNNNGYLQIESIKMSKKYTKYVEKITIFQLTFYI